MNSEVVMEQRCPQCNVVMEEESVPLVKTIQGLITPKVIKSESKHYRCDDCDSEYVTIGRAGKMRRISSPDLE